MLVLPERLKRYTNSQVYLDGLNIGTLAAYSDGKSKFDSFCRVKCVANLGNYECKLSTYLVEDIDNTPQEYELLDKRRFYRNSSWIVRSGTYITEMDEDSFCDAVLLGLDNKKFNCTFCWVYNGGKMKLVPYESDIYNQAKIQVECRKNKVIKSSDLEFGGIYQDLSGSNMLYLGPQNYYDSVYNGYTTQKQKVNKIIWLYFGYYKNTCDNLSDGILSFYRHDFKPRLLLNKINITLEEVKKATASILEFV